MGIWLVLIIIGGLLFVYFNFRVFLKINLTSSFAKIYISFRVLKKEYIFDKKLYYKDIVKKISGYYDKIEKGKSKKYLNYWKYIKKIRHLFLIKNIFLYPECFENSSSFVVEFMIVNNIIKRPILGNSIISDSSGHTVY
jgi:hypothetical protein